MQYAAITIAVTRFMVSTKKPPTMPLLELESVKYNARELFPLFLKGNNVININVFY
jgi:hypothetical protein